MSPYTSKRICVGSGEEEGGFGSKPHVTQWSWLDGGQCKYIAKMCMLNQLRLVTGTFITKPNS